MILVVSRLQINLYWKQFFRYFIKSPDFNNYSTLLHFFLNYWHSVYLNVNRSWCVYLAHVKQRCCLSYVIKQRSGENLWKCVQSCSILLLFHFNSVCFFWTAYLDSFWVSGACFKGRYTKGMFVLSSMRVYLLPLLSVILFSLDSTYTFCRYGIQSQSPKPIKAPHSANFSLWDIFFLFVLSDVICSF